MEAGSTSEGQASHSVGAPSRLLEPVVAAIASSFDCVLKGMVAAGLGIEALCFYLGLTRAALEYNVVRLGLPTPHDRSMRKARAFGRWKPWEIDDLRCAIHWRRQGIHVDCIAERLGRTPGAVRSKLRRLGVPAPPRRELRRVDPRQLPAQASFDFPLPPFEDRRLSVPSRQTGSARKTPAAAIVPPTPAQAAKPAKALGQRELALLQIMRASGGAVPALSDSEPVTSRAGLLGPGARPVIDDDHITTLEYDFSWIRDEPNIVRNKLAVIIISDLHFGLLGFRAAADLLGMSATRLATIRQKIDLPLDRDRAKFHDTYDPELARLNRVACGCALIQEGQRPDGKRGHWFFRPKRRTDRLSLWTQRNVTKTIDKLEYSQYRAQAVLETTTRSQRPAQTSDSSKQGAPYEKLRLGSHAPSQRPGLSGQIGQSMPWTYAGNGSAARHIAYP